MIDEAALNGRETFPSFGEVMAATVIKDRREQDKIGYHFWSGGSIRLGENSERFNLFLKVPAKVEEDSASSIGSFLNLARQFLINKEYTKPSIVFNSQLGVVSYYLNNVEIKQSQQAIETEVSTDATNADYVVVGRVSWGTSGMFLYETELCVSKRDSEMFVGDINTIIQDKDSIRKLKITIPLSENEVAEFGYKD